MNSTTTTTTTMTLVRMLQDQVRILEERQKEFHRQVGIKVGRTKSVVRNLSTDDASIIMWLDYETALRLQREVCARDEEDGNIVPNNIPWLLIDRVQPFLGSSEDAFKTLKKARDLTLVPPLFVSTNDLLPP